jgi:hypothetical protein
MTLEQRPTDLARAWAALEAKARRYDTLWNYYDGQQPLRYSTQRLQAVFQQINVKFTENWCFAVVNAATDRINLTGFQVADNDQATERLAHLFTLSNLGLDSDDTHLAALVCGEGYVIVWKDEEAGIQAYYNDPRLVHVQYDADNPRRMLWAAKRWVADDGTYRMTLYYPERLEYFVTRQKAADVTNAAAFQPAEPPVAVNPFGRIPVFHLRRSLRGIRSELVDVIPLQDAINKLFSDMMVAAEFGAFRQRWIISNADVDTLKNAPNEIWTIPAGDGMGQASQVGEFGQADLGVYLGAMDRLANAIAVITRTPKHYLLAQGGDPSGEALLTMEAPLTRKVERYLERFAATWRQVAAFLLQLDGLTVPAEAITPMFDPVATVQPLTQGQVALVRKQVGISREQALRELGYSEEQIAEMQAEITREEERSGSLGATLLRNFETGFGGV